MKIKLFSILAITAIIATSSCNNDEDVPMPNNEENKIEQEDSTVENVTDEDPVLKNPQIEPLNVMNLSDDEIEANKHINKFAFKFLQSISKNYQNISGSNFNGNLTISPLSTAMCLAMTANSCNEKTEKEITQALGYDNIKSLNGISNKLMRHLSSNFTGTTLKMANSVWYNTDYSLTPDYINLMNNTFGAAVGSFDINKEFESLEKINSWCAYNTENIIPEILTSLNPKMNILLINALYFNSLWETKIDKELTKQAPFHGTNSTTQANMMTTEIRTVYNKTDEYESIYIPFMVGFAQWHMIMPREGVDIETVSKQFTYDKWNEIKNSGKSVDATIHFPKFEIQQKLSLEEVLQSMGVGFQNLEFDKAGVEGLHNLQMLQNTSLSVDEEGVKAAAVTYEIGYSGGEKPEVEKIEMTFDRPFMFFIEHTNTGSILMAGRVCNL